MKVEQVDNGNQNGGKGKRGKKRNNRNGGDQVCILKITFYISTLERSSW
jgi:hypothetical protein